MILIHITAIICELSLQVFHFLSALSLCPSFLRTLAKVLLLRYTSDQVIPLNHPKLFQVHPLFFCFVLFFQIETPTLLQVPSWCFLSLSVPHPSSLIPCTHPHCTRATVLNSLQFLKHLRLEYFHYRPSQQASSSL